LVGNASLQSPTIYVLAGANGAGKSSIGGEMFRAARANYYNPDEEARRLREAYGHGQAAANSMAWHTGRALLERAIEIKTSFAIETTLGGSTLPNFFAHAAESGMSVKIWYCGLASADLHVARVRSRVAHGGHPIPEAKIRERFDTSRERLIQLLPLVAEVKVYDNTIEVRNANVRMPAPALILHTRNRIIQNTNHLDATPDWAKPIVAMAIRIHRFG
jgi:predicted ABC-type ATPase